MGIVQLKTRLSEKEYKKLEKLNKSRLTYKVYLNDKLIKRIVYPDCVFKFLGREIAKRAVMSETDIPYSFSQKKLGEYKLKIQGDVYLVKFFQNGVKDGKYFEV